MKKQKQSLEYLEQGDYSWFFPPVKKYIGNKVFTCIETS